MLSSQCVLGLIAISLPIVQAFFRMPCGQNVVTERIDPIISPGAVSPHVHQVNGGNGIGFSQNYTDARRSTCTTCAFKEDKSNYWTPILYYQSKSGSFTRVPQDGMTVYYLQRGPNPNKLKAFPDGLRMIAGNPFKRNFTGDFAAQAISFNCLDYYNVSNAAGEWKHLPYHACPDGIRAQVFFPSCWDGVNLDSPDHVSHMSYPASGAYNNGPCPASHPVQLVSLFFEVIFGGGSFPWWKGNYGSKQPFVFAMGDPTGYGFHGDFLTGWDSSLLQTVINKCTSQSGTIQDCAAKVPALTIQSGNDMSSCVVPPSVDEDIDGPMPRLLGCNPVTKGPGPAAPVTNCVKTPISALQNPFTDELANGWAYLGCATDVTTSRSLKGYSNIYSSSQTTMTVDICVKLCAASNFIYAGLEYGGQCFCGNSFPSSRLPSKKILGTCNMPCNGNPKQMCGGSNQLNLYKACTGPSCKNYAYVPVGNIAANHAGAAIPASDKSKSKVGPGKSAKSSTKKKSSSTSKTTTSSIKTRTRHMTTTSTITITRTVKPKTAVSTETISSMKK